MDEVWTWMGCGHGWSVDGAWTRIGWQDRASMYMRFQKKNMQSSFESHEVVTKSSRLRKFETLAHRLRKLHTRRTASPTSLQVKSRPARHASQPLLFLYKIGWKTTGPRNGLAVQGMEMTMRIVDTHITAESKSERSITHT